MWETTMFALVALGVGKQPAGLIADGILRKPIAISGKRMPLVQLAEDLQSATGRGIAVSPYVPPQSVFIAAPGQASFKVMDAIADILKTRVYEYQWRKSGPVNRPSYLLSRVPTDVKIRTREAFQRLNAALRSGPKYRPDSRAQLQAADAVPARYQLLRSLPPEVLNKSVATALSGHRVILSLSLFDRNTLMAATGGVTVGSGSPDISKAQIKFSSEAIARGNGYVAVERRILRDGNYGLVLSIGSGTPPPEGRAVVGPSTDIIGNAEKNALRNARFHPPVQPGVVQPPAVKRKNVTIQHDSALKKSESPLANVLRQLAEQSGRAVIARWGDDYKLAQSRLARGIADRPLDEAIRIVAAHYRLRAEVDDDMIQLVPKSEPVETNHKSHPD